MSFFVDASALVAIIRSEPERADLETALVEEPGPHLTSGIAIWEAAMAIARFEPNDPLYGRSEVERLCAMLDLLVVPIGGAEAEEAVRVHTHFGKGRHPARLNMGDCFAYACARTNGARLLYKGDDFARTDMGA